MFKTFTIAKKVIIGSTTLLGIVSYSMPTKAFVHASGNSSSWSASDSRGGTASGGDGSWDATGARGGTASGGDGSWSGTGYRGGTASGGDGSWSGTGYRGGTASGGDGSWHASTPYGTASGGYNTYYGGTYATYHPPTVVNSYSTGCYNCGGWATAGAVAVGAAAASASAYNAGVAAGSAYGMGAIYPTLPAGCIYSPFGGVSYYNCGNVWFSPSYGANGVYYRVVPAP
jgi:hypothetical protein